MSEEFDEEYEERRRRRNARNEEMRKRKKKQQMIRMLMRRLFHVSYTHLDVYKRQPHDFGGGSELPPYSAAFWKMER